ncbi:MAG: shikimate dehydrogenase [Burkholderiaceae bacterium]
MPVINGRTEVLAHIGVPTHTFTSPLIYNPWFAARGIDSVVVPMGCEIEDFDAFLPLVMRLRNVRGALITMPHKVAVTRLLDQRSAAIDICGSCNAVRRDDQGRLVGDMFDGVGFVRALKAASGVTEGASVLLLGAGGVGAAIAAAMAAAGCARLSLYDPRADTAAALKARLATHYPALEIVTGERDPSGHSVVINASPVGMKDDDPSPIDVTRLDAGAFVGDTVLGRKRTSFLAQAEARGHHVVNGNDMLFEQIPAYLDFFGYPVATVAELRRTAALLSSA